MATPPVKASPAPSPVQPPKPNPLHGTPAPAGKVTEATQLQLNIHGIPPQPNMADLPPTEEKHLSEATRAELAAGRAAIQLSRDRHNAELEAGRRAIAHLNSKSEE